MHKEQIRFASGMNLMLGLWLLFSPLLLNFIYSPIVAAEAVVFGLVIAAIAWLRLLHPERLRWASWINFVLGLVLTGSALLLGPAGVGVAEWDFLAVGIPVALFAIWSGGAYVVPGE